ncbi:hypothetical protein, partial, partial [Parasitella parasitica]
MSHSTNNIHNLLSTPTRRVRGRPPMSHDVSTQVDQDASNIPGETLSEAYQDDALPDYTDDAMQIKAESGDVSIAAVISRLSHKVSYTRSHFL